MAQPEARDEGNLRFASQAHSGLPLEGDAPWTCYHEVLASLEGQTCQPYGPLTIIFDLPPTDDDPSTWRCQIGTALTGGAQSNGDTFVEDYRGLQTVSLPFLAASNACLKHTEK